LASARFALAAGLLVLAGAANAAGFDCAKARAEDERAICANPELSKLDDEMTAAYRKLWDATIRYETPAVQAAFRKNQQGWIGYRDRCGGTIGCLRETYKARIAWLAHPLQAYTGHYENPRYRLYITVDRDLKPVVRLFRGTTGEDLAIMEKTARFVPADKADGEDRLALSVQFTGGHGKWADSCRELQIDFGQQLKPSMAFNDGCGFFAKPPEIIALKQRSFTFSDPVR
jgi:uncharacterized protein YecT (DUF1311 family)